ILSVNTKRVVEVGCGTGMILYNVLPHAEHYTAVDISSGVLETLHRQLAKRPEAQAKVKLLHAKADEMGQLEANGSDLVIFNSVVQYFPSIDYLVDVIRLSLHALGERGSIFLGDLRSLPTVKQFHATVALHRSPDERSAEQWLQQVNRDVALENELVIDPEFFYALQAQFPQITRVDVQLKRGRGRNELTQFRYDVILHVGAELSTEVPSYATLDWKRQDLSVAAIRHLLTDEQPPLLVVQHVPDARIFEASYALQLAENGELPATVGDLRILLDEQRGLSVEPDDLYALERDLPYHIEISPANANGCFDVMFRHRSLPATLQIARTCEHKPYAHYATNPSRAKLAHHLVPLYRGLAAESLPDYMVPSAIVILDAFPLTTNGKVDRKALPSPDKNRAASKAEFVAPRNDLEAIVADVWRQVLGIEQISVHDNFFELGGHSLLATQVVSRLRDALEIELSLQRLFEAMTIAQIAEVIEAIFVAEYESLSSEEVTNYLADDEQ
ncbi:MAG: phosphopantetheine-binding protein, partial [Tumebacillaceae bacterium]